MSTAVLLVAAATVLTAPPARSQDSVSYIEAYDGDELTIAPYKYRALDYCAGWQEGDPVTFIQGGPRVLDGGCRGGVLLNLRTRSVCEVECPD